MRALLVEDDAATTASIKMMLNKENYNCDTTALADDGLEIGKLQRAAHNELRDRRNDQLTLRWREADSNCESLSEIVPLAPG